VDVRNKKEVWEDVRIKGVGHGMSNQGIKGIEWEGIERAEGKKTRVGGIKRFR